MTLRARVVAVVLLVLVGLSGGLALAEVVLRFQPPRESRAFMTADPVFHHRLRPNFDAPVQRLRFTTNSLGLHDREYPIPKPAGTYRILMLGDSFTEGGGLPNDGSVAKLVETELRRGACGPRVDVINAGHSSYSPILEYLLLRDVGLRLEPDLVVLNFDMTDVHDDFIRTRLATLDADGLPVAVPPNRRIETALTLPPILPRALRPLENRLAYSSVYQLFRRSKPGFWLFGRGEQTQPQLEARGLIGNLLQDRLAIARDEDFPDVRRGWALTLRYLAGVHELARRHHVPFALVVYPHAYQVSATASPMGRERMGMAQGLFASTRPFTILESFGAARGVPVINLLDLFREREPVQGPLFRERDFHHTAAGTAVFAEGIVRGLRARRLVPCDAPALLDSPRPSGRTP